MLFAGRLCKSRGLTSQILKGGTRAIAASVMKASASPPRDQDQIIDAQTSQKDASQTELPPTKRKTQAELDAEMIAKIKGAYGDRDEGGAAGVEYEDGKPVAMKRGVKANMFRYI
ncbi:hypothetical protein BDZ85DRAFT_46389 [Elsinoe ampelina]|uniref:Uncharacterized protein n=1 Tax=Elsinoe ampelina TaxID=302913 RepID=A0A6A6G0K7_9PEZI|nr:hypothetical protein BDZ85DRAFT_46389 [Elsinoe ampelina]